MAIKLPLLGLDWTIVRRRYSTIGKRRLDPIEVNTNTESPPKPERVYPATAMRIAVVSTPRSGNTWVRQLLSRYYRLEQQALHSVDEQSLDSLPDQVALQIHWRNEPGFAKMLTDRGFKIVTVTRHPFDVLISILHFCWYDFQTQNWLLGKCGTEDGLRGAMPRSRAFVNYAKSCRAAELLAVSADWWTHPDAVPVRYESMVFDPIAGLKAISERLGPPRCESVEKVIEECSLGSLRHTSDNNHFWKGRAGLWRELLPAAEAEEIAAAIAPVLKTLGYECNPDPNLTADQADETWVKYVGQELKDTLQGWRERHLLAHKHALKLTSLLEDAEANKRKLYDYWLLEGAPINLARSLHKWRLRFPGLLRLGKRLMGKKIDPNFVPVNPYAPVEITAPPS